jgi:hypothetical protein
MKKLDISITKAMLTSFGVELKEGKPEVHVTIALMTEGGKAITTYTIYTDDWHSDKFVLPVEAMPLIGDIARILEGVAVRHCRDSQLALPAPKKKSKVDTVIADQFDGEIEPQKVDLSGGLGDQPINLDDIPF